ELLVDGSHSAWDEQEIGPDSVLGRAPSGTHFSVNVTNFDVFRSFRLGFLDHAEVLSPPSARDAVARWLTGLAEPS
ncbi:MAG: WYL domain-containing protein, partial [Acidimicrobiales bacterium]